MLIELLTPIVGLLDKIIPDPKAREAAKVALMQAQGQRALQEAQTQLSAILTEAQSQDPWTSRARPAFLYVIYTLLLASLPMGVFYALNPSLAKLVTEGFQAWLTAIPEPLMTLFGVGYLGYTGARSIEKWGKRK